MSECRCCSDGSDDDVIDGPLADDDGQGDEVCSEILAGKLKIGAACNSQRDLKYLSVKNFQGRFRILCCHAVKRRLFYKGTKRFAN